MEVVHGLLGSGDFVIELVVATIVDSGDTECKTAWNTNAEGELAALPVLGDLDVGASECVKVGEGYSYRGAVGAKNIVGGSSWASGAIDTNARDVEASRSSHAATLREVHRGSDDCKGGRSESDERGDELHGKDWVTC